MKKILTITLLLFPLFVSAAGIQVSPSKLDLEGEAGKSLSAEITVSNPTSDIQLFEVYPDDLEDVVSADPKSFTLEAGAKKIVKITASSQTPGILKTNLSVVSKPLADSRFNADTGVKIPIEITAAEKADSSVPNLNFYIIVGIIIFGFFSVDDLLQRKRKS